MIKKYGVKFGKGTFEKGAVDGGWLGFWIQGEVGEWISE